MCIHPILIKRPEASPIYVKCGKCLSCLTDRANEWTARNEAELLSAKSTIWITLTYDEDHVPLILDKEKNVLFPTVSKRDIQLFLKRLRANLTEYAEKTHQKYDFICRHFIVSEYGPKTNRPHYHGCLYFYIDTPANILDRLALLWGNSSVNTFSYVEPGGLKYITKYCLKECEPYLSKYQSPNFMLSSRKPGIGCLRLDKQLENKAVLSDSLPFYDATLHNLEGFPFKAPRICRKHLFDKAELVAINKHKDYYDAMYAKYEKLVAFNPKLTFRNFIVKEEIKQNSLKQRLKKYSL